MHPTEPKSAFIMMRGNGWSLGRISNKLGIPKSTLFNWESDAVNRRAINVIKSLQVEKLQENYLPSFEEELQQLSKCLNRIERALDKQDFETMRPEFLLRTALQVRSRLHKFRNDVQPVRTLDEGELSPVHGCISRSQTEIPDFESDSSASSPSPGGEGWGEGVSYSASPEVWGEGASSSPSPGGEGRGEGVPLSESSASPNGTKRDENHVSLKLEPSDPAPSVATNGTTVPFSQTAEGPAPSPSNSENGRSLNGTERDENADPAQVEHSQPTTSADKNGTIVPFSNVPGRERYGDLATPLTTLPPLGGGEQIALTAGFPPSRSPASPASPAPSSNPRLARQIAEALRQIHQPKTPFQRPVSAQKGGHRK